MKTAYELAMERLNQTSPTTKLTAKQKAAMAELDSKYAARIAEQVVRMALENLRFTRLQVVAEVSPSRRWPAFETAGLTELLLELVEHGLAHQDDRQKADPVDAVVKVLERSPLIQLSHLLEVVFAQEHPLEVPERRRRRA